MTSLDSDGASNLYLSYLSETSLEAKRAARIGSTPASVRHHLGKTRCSRTARELTLRPRQEKYEGMDATHGRFSSPTLYKHRFPHNGLLPEGNYRSEEHTSELQS